MDGTGLTGEVIVIAVLAMVGLLFGYAATVLGRVLRRLKALDAAVDETRSHAVTINKAVNGQPPGSENIPTRLGHIDEQLCTLTTQIDEITVHGSPLSATRLAHLENRVDQLVGQVGEWAAWSGSVDGRLDQIIDLVTRPPNHDSYGL